MAHQPYSAEEYKKSVNSIWKTTGILAVVTVVEVIFALIYEFKFIPMGAPRIFLSLFVIAASAVKAFYIMSIFMHLGHEKKGMQFTILFPFLFLVWGIIAFILEGSAWESMKDAFNGLY